MNRRRIKVVDNVFQYRMIAILLLMVVCGFAAFTAGALIVFAIARARGFDIPGARMLSVFPPILVNDIVIMIILIVAGIYVTLRIAGPVYRIQSDIKRVLAGEKRVKVRFRRRDAFPELAERVNQLIERIDNQP